MVSLSALQVTDSSGVMPSGCPPPRRRHPTISEHKDPILIKSHHSDSTPSGILRLRFDDETTPNPSYQRTRPAKATKILSAPHFLCFSPRSVIGCAFIPDLFHLCSPYLSPAQTLPCLLLRSRGQAVMVNGFFFFFFHVLHFKFTGESLIRFVAFSQYAFICFGFDLWNKPD